MVNDKDKKETKLYEYFTNNIKFCGVFKKNCIEVTKTEFEDNTMQKVKSITVAELPPCWGRMSLSGEMKYLIPSLDGKTMVLTSSRDIFSGQAWKDRGDARLVQNQMRDTNGFGKVWEDMTLDYPILSPSPKITEGLPPLMLMPLYEPQNNDENAAIEAVAELGRRLSPLGRIAMGMLIAAPWLLAAGGTQSWIHFKGVGDYGKTTLLCAGASLYGPHQIGKGIAQTFYTTENGIAAKARSYDYIPLLIDELKEQNGNVNQVVNQLMSGADKSSSGRDGSSRDQIGEFRSIVLSTSNNNLPAFDERFNRRVIEMDAENLWNPDVVVYPPKNEDYVAASKIKDDALREKEFARLDKIVKDAEIFWVETYELLNEIEGWPWYAIRHQFEPGTDSSYLPIEGIRHQQTVGESSLGFLGKAGLWGCAWLQEYSNEPDWTNGVTTAAREMISKQKAKKKNVPAEMAEAVVEDIESNPGAWVNKPDDTSMNVPTYLKGWATVDTPKKNNVKCRTPHDGVCEWWDVLPKTLNGFYTTLNMDLDRLWSDEKWLEATYLYAVDKEGRTRAVYNPFTKTKTKVTTLCKKGLGEMLELRSDFSQGITVVAGNVAKDSRPELNITSETKGKKEMKITYSKPDLTDDEFEDFLDRAYDAGYTDAVVPVSLRLKRHGMWTTKASFGDVETATFESGARKIIVRRPQNTQLTPEQWAQMVETFNKIYERDYWSRTATAVDLVTKTPRRASSTPRYFNPEEIAKKWDENTREYGILTPSSGGISRNDIHNNKENYIQLDRNKAHLSSLKNVSVAPLLYTEEWNVWTPDSVEDIPLPRRDKVAGMYLVELPEWKEDFINPSGSNKKAGEKVWISSEMMKLYNDENIMPVVLEAVTAPVHSFAAFIDAQKTILNWLDVLGEDPATLIVKGIYQSMSGRLRARKVSKINRFDWGQALWDNSWCNVWRKAREIYKNNPDFKPARINVDAIYYDKALGIPEEITVGTGIKDYKINEIK